MAERKGDKIDLKREKLALWPLSYNICQFISDQLKRDMLEQLAERNEASRIFSSWHMAEHLIQEGWQSLPP